MILLFVYDQLGILGVIGAIIAALVIYSIWFGSCDSSSQQLSKNPLADRTIEHH
jgi:hypothetical protein